MGMLRDLWRIFFGEGRGVRGEGAEVWVVSGFFLGRESLVGFLNVAAREGLDVREVFEQNAVGERRAWMVDGGMEDGREVVEQGWLLVAVLCHREGEML